jgi:hypothetical protein
VEVLMKKTRNILAWVGAHVAASMVIGSTAFGQFAAGVPGAIVNVNLGGTVGINTGGNTIPPPALGNACDPLDIGNVGPGGGIGAGPVPAMRLSEIFAIGACAPPNTNYGQLGFETTGGGVFSTLSGLRDIVLTNRSKTGDIFIASRATNGGVGVGAVRFSTVNGAGTEVQRMSIENNGNIGMGLSLPTVPQNRLDVAGSVAIGSGAAYAGGTAAPADGMIVQGAVGIGNSAPGGGLQLDVTGDVNMSNNVTIGNDANVGNDVTAGNNITAGNDVTVGGNLNFGATSQLFDVAGASGGAGQVLTVVGGQPTWATLPAAGGGWALVGNLTAASDVLGSTNRDVPIIANNTTWIYVDDPNGVAIGNGVTSAGAALDVTGDVQFSGELLPGGASGTATYLLQANGIGFAPSWVDPATVVGSSAWSVSGNNPASGSFIGTVTSATNPDLVFKTDGTERMRILGSSTGAGTAGFIGINTASPGTTYRLNLNGSLTATGAFFSSDARWKQNITTIENPLAKVLALHGVNYEYRTAENPDRDFPQGMQMGLIAQEVEKVVPEVVRTNDDGYKAIAYQNLVGLLIESTKEQQSVIESQRATIDNLSARLSRLEAMIDPSLKPVTPTVKEEGQSIQLEQNTPNPFDRTTIIRYMVPNSVGSAEMVIFEAGTGREVERFLIANRGEGEVTVSVAGLASGSYVYGIVADGKLAQTRTMVIAR